MLFLYLEQLEKSLCFFRVLQNTYYNNYIKLIKILIELKEILNIMIFIILNISLSLMLFTARAVEISTAVYRSLLFFTVVYHSFQLFTKV